MSIFENKPWEGLWGDTKNFHGAGEYSSALDMFLRNRASTPDGPLVTYFDRTWTSAETDAESDALACQFQEVGLVQGDRVGLYLQNMPEFVMATLAAWKIGASVVPINPMYQEREFLHIAHDSGIKALVVLDELVHIVDAVRDQSDLSLVITTNGLRALAPMDELPAPLKSVKPAQVSAGVVDYDEVLATFAGRKPCPAEIGGGDVAFLAYTSGTTGPPKGAMLSHANVVFSSQTFRSMRSLTDDDVIFATAPLFHVTGLICTLGLGLLLPGRMVLGYRFDITSALRLIDQYKATFTVGATTVFIAFLENPEFARVDISSLTKIVCGGAAIPPSVVERYEQATGVYLHNGYGMTETTSPTFGSPVGHRSPVHAESGALALGIPVPDTECKLLDDDNNEVAHGEPGEIVVRGPHVMLGYWNKPEETAKALHDGWLRTGDVAVMDEQGWFYLVDRKKDQINASGFKVWPQEVEEVLYEHPAVRETAVIGVPDEYRGETVMAVVSLRDGQTATADELSSFARERLAAYKVPRIIRFMDDLPKTVTGKITRRSLREAPGQQETQKSGGAG